MAGIGFQLKKLFQKEGLLANIKAYFYSTTVTIGPTLICIFVITALNFFLKNLGVKVREIEVLQATIMYSFIFSLILISGYNMIISRYLADKLYTKNYDDILPSLFGSFVVMIPLGGILGIIFYLLSPIDFLYKVFAYGLFIQLIIQSILSCYISALKNYKKIATGFFIGIFTGILFGVLYNMIFGGNLVLISLISFDLALLIINIIFAMEIQKYFCGNSKKYFEYLTYFIKFKPLFFVNFFWMMGLYVHHFIMWTVPSLNLVIENTFIYAPAYDVPSFYAFLTIMPTMVIFVVKLETAFFAKYSSYYYLINNGASYEDIELAKLEMKEILRKEIVFIMEIQLFFSIAFIILGIKILPLIGFTTGMLNLFNLMVLGYYCAIMVFVTMTILLYYDDKFGAAMTTFIFFAGNFILTLITLWLGEEYYGLGLFISALIALIYGMIRLRHFVRNIDYYVFCNQSSWSEDK